MAETDPLELPVGLTEKQFLQQIARIEARLNKTTNAIEKRFQTQNRSIARGFRDLERSSSRSFSSISSAALRAAAAVGSFAYAAGRLVRTADNYKTIENRLRSIGQEGDDAGEKLLAAALRSRTGIIEMSTAVARFEKSTGDGFDTSIRRIETLNKLLAVGGATATEVSSVMTQLSQALTSGSLQGDELRSLRENAPIEVLDAIAAAAGVTRGELKKLGEEGRLTTAVITRALDSLADTADSKFSDMTQTVGQGITNVGSAFTVFFGRLDQGLGLTDELASGLDNVARSLADNADAAEDFGEAISSALETAKNLVAELGAELTALGNSGFFQQLNEALGITEGGQLINPDVREAEQKIDRLEGEISDLQAQIENNTLMGFDNTEALARLGEVRSQLAAIRAEAAAMPRYVGGINRGGSVNYNMVDSGTWVDSYSAPPKPPTVLEPITIPAGGGGGSSKGGKKSGGGRKGKTERPFFEDIEKDLLNLQREIELVGKSNEQIAEARARWELLDEAKKRGMPINEQLNEQINAQAAEVGRLTGELERAEIAQQQFDAAIDGIADAMAGALVAGESLRDGLAQVLKGIASDIINSGIRDALLGQFGGGGGNILGGIGRFLTGDRLSGALRGAGLPAFDGGGFTGMGVRSGGIDGKGGFPAILHPNETVVDHTRGQTSGSMSYSPSIVVQGDASEKTLSLIENALERDRQQYFSRWMAAQKQFGSRIA